MYMYVLVSFGGIRTAKVRPAQLRRKPPTLQHPKIHHKLLHSRGDLPSRTPDPIGALKRDPKLILRTTMNTHIEYRKPFAGEEYIMKL